MALTTYYTDSIGGNDTTGDGSSGNPYQTVQKALDVIALQSHGNSLYYRVMLRNNHTIPSGGWVIGWYPNQYQRLFIQGELGSEIATTTAATIFNGIPTGVIYANFVIRSAFLSNTNIVWDFNEFIGVTLEYTGSSTGYFYTQGRTGVVYDGCTFIKSFPYIGIGNIVSNCIADKAGGTGAFFCSNANGVIITRTKFLNGARVNCASGGGSTLIEHCSFELESSGQYAIDPGNMTGLIVRDCAADGPAGSYLAGAISSSWVNWGAIICFSGNRLGNGGILEYNAAVAPSDNLYGSSAVVLDDTAFSDANLTPTSALKAEQTSFGLTPGAVQASAAAGGGSVLHPLYATGRR